MLCEALAKQGNEVTVITSVPHYPSGNVPAEFRGKRAFKSNENGVQVTRLGLPSINRSNLWARLFQFIVFQFKALIDSMHCSYDILLTHTPSLEIWLPFAYHSVIRNKPAVYSVHDVYPDVGIRLGIFRSKASRYAVGFLEKFCLKHAKKVRVLSPSFVPALKRMGVEEEKLCLIYDWVDTNAISPSPRRNDFSIEQDLTNDFVVLYAGNIGLVQGLDTVIDSARLLAEERDIRFVFVGDGAGLKALIEKKESLRLTNVDFISYQPRERMSEIFATADISLVSLKEGTSFGALPSKTYSIMASERPIIASVDQGSDIWNLIERSECGVCVPAENPSLLAEAIKCLKFDYERRIRLGKKGREYVLKNHSPQSAAAQFDTLLKQLMRESRQYS
jgi:colanic acid biosynthesis glycosyl transferase WcaI